MKEIIKKILIFVAVLYGVWLLDLILVGYDLNQWGIVPRTFRGLIGILLSPFFHVNIFHLLSNTIPLIILSFLAFKFYPKKALASVSIIVVLGGFLVWIFGGTGNHIGASGLIYGLATFISVHGFLTKDLKNIGISILVIILYGGLIWGVLPTKWWISWESHLFGALAGAFSAYIFRTKNSEQGV